MAVSNHMSSTQLKGILSGLNIKINDETKPLLVHALDQKNLPLFSAAIAAGADCKAPIDPDTIDKKKEQTTILELLKQKVANDPYCYKPFYRVYKQNLNLQTSNTYKDWIINNIVNIATACMFAIFVSINFLMFAQGVFFKEENLRLFKMLFDTLPIFASLGVINNCVFFAKRVSHNFNNPAKNIHRHLITLFYDLSIISLRLGRFLTYIIYGSVPMAGSFFIASYVLATARYSFKFFRALTHSIHYYHSESEKYKSSIDATVHDIRAYQYALFKTFSTLSQITTSTALVGLMFAYFFLPLAPLGALVVGTSVLSLGLVKGYAKPTLRNFFETRAQSEIDAYLKTKNLPAQTKVDTTIKLSTKSLLSKIDSDFSDTKNNTVKVEQVELMTPKMKKLEFFAQKLPSACVTELPSLSFCKAAMKKN